MQAKPAKHLQNTEKTKEKSFINMFSLHVSTTGFEP
jgi:hypothetical protein